MDWSGQKRNILKPLLLLGAGRVGSAICHDLSADYPLMVADASEDALHRVGTRYKVETHLIDFTDLSAFNRLIAGAELVIGAVPGFMGFNLMGQVLECGKSMVDISFFPEDPFDLDALAKKNAVFAITDIGVAPGLDNILLGYHDRQMNVKEFRCLVGGLPENPVPPFNYKAPFSPIDVIEEYLRPARLKIDGKIITRPALTDPEMLEFPEIGTLEAFNTDGLRTLLHTFPHVPTMVEKTLRYPGHCEQMLLLRDAGFFGEEAIVVNDQSVRPIDLTAQLLLSEWALEENEPEFTVMQVDIKGTDEAYSYQLLDRYDPDSRLSSMARTTGFTCTAAVRYILEKNFQPVGIVAPEHLGAREGFFEFLMSHFKKLGIRLVIH